MVGAYRPSGHGRAVRRGALAVAVLAAAGAAAPARSPTRAAAMPSAVAWRGSLRLLIGAAYAPVSRRAFRAEGTCRKRTFRRESSISSSTPTARWAGSNSIERKSATCGAFAEPSDGLEPSTPSLPCEVPPHEPSSTRPECSFRLEATAVSVRRGVSQWTKLRSTMRAASRRALHRQAPQRSAW